MASNLEQRLKQQRKSRHRYTWIVAVLALLVAILAGAVSFWWFGGRLSSPRAAMKRTPETENYIMPPNKLNILIMGVDDRPKEDDPGRSDTLMVMTLIRKVRKPQLFRFPGTPAYGSRVWAGTRSTMPISSASIR